MVTTNCPDCFPTAERGTPIAVMKAERQPGTLEYE
jgi:hypothetical protein